MALRSRSILILCQLLAFLVLPVSGAYADTVSSSDASGAVVIAPGVSQDRVAPGESLPVSVKLVNFGSQQRVDVTVNYQIFDSLNQQVYSSSETVAVDTTASFIKQIRIPAVLSDGTYTLETFIYYPYQQEPAISKFSFRVEGKWFGVFKSDFLWYAALAVIAALVIVLITYLLSRTRRSVRMISHDYSDKPRGEIIYYEILSDIISEMRMHIGDDAIRIAQDIPDLTVDSRTGKILRIAKNPSRIIALLIFRYESLLGRKLSFGLRNKL